MNKRTAIVSIRVFGILLSAALIIFNFSEQMQTLRELPDRLYSGSEFESFIGLEGVFDVEYSGAATVGAGLDETLNADTDATVTITILKIPVKSVELVSRDTVTLVPGGQAMGIRMYTEVLVVGFGKVVTENGAVSPAQEAGIAVGDIIVSVDSSPVDNAADLSELSNERQLVITVDRGGRRLDFTVNAAQDITDGAYRLGMWVRDSTLGIGTLTYYDPVNGDFGALGRAITDADTGSELIVTEGYVSASMVYGVSKGEQGTPGELHGMLMDSTKTYGVIEDNTAYGIFGRLDEYPADLAYPNGLPIAYRDEIQLGDAQLLATVDETGVQAFSCKVIKVLSAQSDPQKRLVIEITDTRLIEITGGIVQGMSGSPIIQDGKLVGAVTHVLLNDPQKGYGICVEDMLSAASN